MILEVAPPSAAETLQGPIDSITSNGGAAGVGADRSASSGALWGASGYVGAFARASNVDLRDARGPARSGSCRPLQVLVTLVMVALLALVTLALALSGPVVEAIAEPLGVGIDRASTRGTLAKWPILVAAAILLFSILYATAPNVRQRRLTSIVPGVALALAVWAVASVGFALYVANFALLRPHLRDARRGRRAAGVAVDRQRRAAPAGPSSTPSASARSRCARACRGPEREIQLERRDDPDRPRTE